MSLKKIQIAILISQVKSSVYKKAVKRIKKETYYRGMSFSKMCDLGSEIVMKIYDSLDKDAAANIMSGDELMEMIRDIALKDIKDKDKNEDVVTWLENREK